MQAEAAQSANVPGYLAGIEPEDGGGAGALHRPASDRRRVPPEHECRDFANVFGACQGPVEAHLFLLDLDEVVRYRFSVGALAKQRQQRVGVRVVLPCGEREVVCDRDRIPSPLEQLAQFGEPARAQPVSVPFWRAFFVWGQEGRSGLNQPSESRWPVDRPGASFELRAVCRLWDGEVHAPRPCRRSARGARRTRRRLGERSGMSPAPARPRCPVQTPACGYRMGHSRRGHAAAWASVRECSQRRRGRSVPFRPRHAGTGWDTCGEDSPALGQRPYRLSQSAASISGIGRWAA